MSFFLAHNFGLIALQKRVEFLAATDHVVKNVQETEWIAPFTFTASIVPTAPVPQDAAIINGRQVVIGSKLGGHDIAVDRGQDRDMTALMKAVSFGQERAFLNRVLTRCA